MKNKIIPKNILILLSIYLLGCISSFVVYYRASLSFEEVVSLFNSDTYIEESLSPALVENVSSEELSEPVNEDIAEGSVCMPVDVSGAVKSPGVFCMDDNSVVVDALKKAGGFVEGAAYKYVSMNLNLAQRVRGNMKIYIPYTKDLYCETVEFELPSKIEKVVNPVVEDEGDDDTPDCVNLNTASKEELESLSGIGSSTAQKIMDARPYSQLEDLLNVSGIGQSTYDGVKDDICL